MTLIGKVLADRYEIIEEIGSGGTAVVYKAKCKLLQRYVAVKVLRPDLQNDEDFVRRFNVEAQAAASLTHPNIVSIFDVGTSEGLHYIVMEYIEGKTLKEYIDEKRILPWREAVGYAIQIAKGLAQAHRNSIIHRDIKPHNIIMKEDGVLKVTDFGIARANVQTTMTCEDTAIGSVHYISPEQARGGFTDERSDIYSLGVVLYEMLTGKVPFDSDRPVSVAIMHLQDTPVAPREHNLSIPLPIEKIVLKAMTKEVSGRYKNATEMIEDMERILNDPTRGVVVDDTKDGAKDEGMDAGHTIMMPAIKINKKDEPVKTEKKQEDIPVEVHEEKAVKPRVKIRRKAKAPKEPLNLDKQKERKVIAVAVASAVLIIALIGFGFASILGLGGGASANETVEIPDLEGMTYDRAIEKYVDIDEEGLDYKFNIVRGKSVENTLPKDTILSQDPLPDSKVKKKDVIVITVELSAGSSDITLKNYTRYKDSREVEIEMEKLDLKCTFEEEFNDEIPKGSIIRQDPESGTTVKKGDMITFYVSKGPENAEKDPDEGEDKPSTEVQKPNTPTTGEDKPVVQDPPAKKKSTMLTLYGPKDKDSAVVKVTVNGKQAYSKTLQKGQSDVVKLEGTSNSVEVEIFYDGVSQQKATVNLH